MKTSDWISMVAIALIGAAFSVWITNMILGDPDKASLTYKYMNPISSAVAEPDVDIFNVNAINPTVEVYVGSCMDQDGDGVINSAEQRACNEIKEE